MAYGTKWRPCLPHSMLIKVFVSVNPLIDIIILLAVVCYLNVTTETPIGIPVKL